ncbi:MAG: Lrp/AsnC family transcriptional regulator [Candidatus Aureabacteria bacterium]|nr:Lrp/AsnC family transcriptional regulator [Candidatus Auribacterota bacterium]
MDEILEILQNNAKADSKDMAKQLNLPEQEVKKRIMEYEKKGVIIKYKAIINKELLTDEIQDVTALIEVKVTPQKDKGFDSIAERIYRFPEVVSCYLLSGGYDLLVIVRGPDLKTVSSFVSEKLAPMENINGTVTHFILKKYKDDGDILISQHPKDTRPAVSA